MKQIVIIGGGPAGLMAAEIVASAGWSVTVYDHMTSPGRKFLMAGRGGLNLTHSEPLDQFIARYEGSSNAAASWLDPVIRNFPPEALREWCHGLGQPTFVGTSGRVFPESLKASPLLRAWLRRLDERGVRFAFRHRWTGWDRDGRARFVDKDQKHSVVKADAFLLALGGASWPRLGSDGSWVEILAKDGILISPLRPANCGFVVPWSDIFCARFQGQPLKSIAMSFGNVTREGEVVITANGLEGGLMYAFSSRLRDSIMAKGSAVPVLDMRPGLSLAKLTERLQMPRGSQSFSNYLRKVAGLSSVAMGLLYEVVSAEKMKAATPLELANLIKACPVRLTATRELDRAISTAGGICSHALDQNFMLRQKPGVFVAGEMLDWEAPTGGYLLQATFSTAVAAAQGVLRWGRVSRWGEGMSTPTPDRPDG